MHVALLCTGGGTELQLCLCSPKDADEQCPITQCFIGGKQEEDEDNIPPALLQSQPELHCLEIEPCKHRFNARALLLHFIHNKLNCPLCRHGAKTPIDLSRGTFAQEEWVPHAMQLAIRSAMQERERQSQQDWHMLHAHAPYADVTIRVSVHALAENHEWLLSRMACVDSARGIYRMTTWGLRVLRRLHGRLCASGMTFEVFGRVQEDDPPVVLMSTERIRTFALLSQGLGQVPSHRDGTWEHHSRVVDPNGASITVQFLAQPHSPWEFREIIFQLP